MVLAYVLIQTEVGKAASVAEEARKIPGVESADDVTGPYDVVVRASAGDVDQLAKVFAEDVVLWSDGGGKARAARHPLFGAARVARHLIGVSPQAPEGMEVRIVRTNGDPSIMAVLNDVPIAIVSFEVSGTVVTGVRALLNPDKLQRLHVVAN